MKRVLMIVPFFPPMAGGGVYRPLSLARYLPRYGWEPTVVTPRGDAYWLRDEQLEDRIPDACRVVRTDTLSGQSLLARLRRGARAPQTRSSRRFGAVRRLAAATLMPDTYVGWYPYAVRAGRRLLSEGKFDAVYSTSPPETSHMVGMKLHRRSGLPWVADFRDPWMNLYLLPPPTPVHAALHRKLESRVCARARVVVTTQWHEQLIRRQYPQAAVERISNGFDAAEMANVTDRNPATRPMRIMHAGMLTQKRTAVPFLHALRAFLERTPTAREDIEVVFVGPREDENDRAARELGLGSVVRFLDSVPHLEALRMQRASHILLLIKHANPDYVGLVPGKLYEYIGLRRPILALAPDGEARALVDGLGRGATALPEDVDAIADHLAKMYGHYRAGVLDDEYDLTERTEYDRAEIAGEMARVLDAITT